MKPPVKTPLEKMLFSQKKTLLIASISGFLAVAVGAFGAHALKKLLTVVQLNSFETGLKYLMYHALFLLFVGNTSLMEMKHKKTVFYLTILGVIMFSLSIFLLTTSSIFGFNLKFLGPITPIGGLFLILSWSLSFYYILIKKV